MARNRGEQLEHQFIKSLPHGVFHQKLHTPAPPVGRLIAYIKSVQPNPPGWVQGLMRSSFTATQPFDLIVSVPTPAAPMLDYRGVEAQPAINFALELKSAGDQKSLPFDAVRDSQESGLLKAAAVGWVSGLVIDFPLCSPSLYFLPFNRFMQFKAESERKSIPFDHVRVFGIEIEMDESRGRVHSYWKLDEFFSKFLTEAWSASAPMPVSRPLEQA